MRSRDAPPSTSMSSPSDRGSRASFLEGPYLRVGCPFRRTAALLTPGTVAPRSRRAATIRSAPTPRAYAICWSLWACAGLTERIALVASGGLGHGVSFALRAATLPGAELALRIASTFTPRWLMNLGRRMGRALPSISPADLDRDMVIPIAHTLAAHDLLPTSTLEIFGGAGTSPTSNNRCASLTCCTISWQLRARPRRRAVHEQPIAGPQLRTRRTTAASRRSAPVVRPPHADRRCCAARRWISEAPPAPFHGGSAARATGDASTRSSRVRMTRRPSSWRDKPGSTAWRWRSHSARHRRSTASGAWAYSSSGHSARRWSWAPCQPHWHPARHPVTRGPIWSGGVAGSVPSSTTTATPPSWSYAGA